jgi:serine/threonine protein phosphatase PrpC
LVQACGISDVGRVRKTNEDTFVSDPDVRLFAVADGMGTTIVGVLVIGSRVSVGHVGDSRVYLMTNVLGVREHVDIHLMERDLRDGEMLLLCSDGLHGVMDGDAIRTTVAAASDVQTAAHQLVGTAMERGSRDNVTALVVRYAQDR